MRTIQQREDSGEDHSAAGGLRQVRTIQQREDSGEDYSAAGGLG